MLDNTALYNLLLELGVVEKSALEEAYSETKQSGGSLEQLLLERDLISDENLGVLVADAIGVPFVRLEKTVLNREMVEKLPEEMCRAKRILLFDENKIAMTRPDDVVTINLIKKRFGPEVKVFYATERDIKTALFAYRRAATEIFEDLIREKADQIVQGEEGELSIVKLVETIMIYAYQSRASDVHIEPSEEYVQVRFRIDGVLWDIVRLAKKLEPQIILRIKILSGLPTDGHEAALDGKFSYSIPDVEEVDVRVSIVPATNGERVVMRLLAGNIKQFALLDLGMSEPDIVKVREAYSKPYGMILSTGPTGSGKTTTMYAFIKILNRRDVNIMTIEDPVEYRIPGVNQIQVNPRTNLTFAAGLKSIVRQDPNIILVGEVRDEETAGIAVNAAMTGHLVLSTLHTSDAATAIPRLLDMEIEPFLVASSVNLIVAQRLVRKICTSCRVSEVRSVTEFEGELSPTMIGKHLEKEKDGVRTYAGKGCDLCRQTGYIGRVGVFEVLPVTEKIKDAIVAKKDAEAIRNIAIEEGMETMIDDGLNKVRVGITTIEELLRVVKE